jgi:uncharacterized Fe-S cluster-containing radical SAM superfamily protein
MELFDQSLTSKPRTRRGFEVITCVATTYFSKQMQLMRHFKNPAPMREVSVVVHRDFVKQRLIQALKDEIISAIPEKIKKNKNQNVISL